MASGVFSDSWFRVANMQVALLPTVKVQQQVFRGKPWYVLQDTYTQRFFRVSPPAYSFISLLTPDKTVEQAWLEFIESDPEDAPGQEEVIQVLSQLHMANLLYFRHQPDNEAIFGRSKKQKERETIGKMLSFLYFRVPLWDPDPWLSSVVPFVRFMTSRLVGALWVFVVLYGSATAFEHREALIDKSQGLLALGNLPWLYASMAGLKFLHEMGHAFVCKRFGGEVRTFGLMFLLFTPLPYMDATAAWSFKNNWQRALVGAAGMMVEFFLASIGAVVWANTGTGLINSVAFNVMIIGSVSSILFNGNPLLRFDAYYILSDIVEIPNLYQKAQQQWLYFADRYILGTAAAKSPAGDHREWVWLTAYGALSFIYMIVVTVGISLFLLDQWFPLGVAAIVVTLVTRVMLPLNKLWNHLHGPKVQRNRRRATGSVLLIVGIFLALGLWLPLPYSIKAHGSLEAHQSSILYARLDGIVVRVATRSGTIVQPDQVLAELRNPDLDQDLEVTRQSLKEADSQYREALFKSPGSLAPIRRRIEQLQDRMQDLEKMNSELVLRAPHAGEWVAPSLHEYQGAWVHRGQVLGVIVDRTRFRFAAVVPQEQADELFNTRIAHGVLRLAGQFDEPIGTDDFKLIPYHHQKLASAALGWMGGGEIPVKTDERSGQIAVESFYVLYAMLPEVPPDSVTMMHGMTGQLKIALPWEPAFWQARRSLLQLMQKRYGV